jgi:hypothetical protein
MYAINFFFLKLNISLIVYIMRTPYEIQDHYFTKKTIIYKLHAQIN